MFNHVWKVTKEYGVFLQCSCGFPAHNKAEADTHDFTTVKAKGKK